MSQTNQTLSFSEFAEEVLQVYQSRVAQDWADGLAFMSTSGGRVDLLKKVQDRATSFLTLNQPEPAYTGAAVEAILGEFGSGKSHLGFLLKAHFSSAAPRTLIVHAQMTGDRTIGEVWARALQNLWLSQTSSQVVSGMEMSAYDALRSQAILSSPPVTGKFLKQVFKPNSPAPLPATALTQTAQRYLRKLPPTFANDFANAVTSGDPSLISEFLNAWVAKESALLANEAFQAILGTFNAMGVARRVVFLLDEVEALESLERHQQLAAVQSFQDMHDDFAFRVAGLPPLFWVFLSTEKFWRSGREMLPSFFGERDRTRVISNIPPLEKFEVYALADRYSLLLQLTGRLPRPLSSEQLLTAADAAWEQLAGEGRLGHMRSIHSVIREKVALQAA